MIRRLHLPYVIFLATLQLISVIAIVLFTLVGTNIPIYYNKICKLSLMHDFSIGDSRCKNVSVVFKNWFKCYKVQRMSIEEKNKNSLINNCPIPFANFPPLMPYAISKTRYIYRLITALIFPLNWKPMSCQNCFLYCIFKHQTWYKSSSAFRNWTRLRRNQTCCFVYSTILL